LTNATAKDARVSRSQGSKYEAGSARKHKTATGIEIRQIPPRYNFDLNGVSLHFMTSKEPYQLASETPRPADAAESTQS